MPALASIVGPNGVAPKKILTGVVVSAGKMDKCVKVRIAKQEWNKQLHKVCRATRSWKHAATRLPICYDSYG